jgi:hypothetical protein
MVKFAENAEIVVDWELAKKTEYSLDKNIFQQ